MTPNAIKTVTKRETDQDVRKGAVEGNRPDDDQTGNANAPALDENGLPNDQKAIAEDSIGANEDKTQG